MAQVLITIGIRRRLHPHPSLEPMMNLYGDKEISQICKLLSEFSDQEQQQILDYYEKPIRKSFKRRQRMNEREKEIRNFFEQLSIRDKMLIVTYMEISAMNGVNIEWADKVGWNCSDESQEIADIARQKPELKYLVELFDSAREINFEDYEINELEVKK